MMEPPVKVLFKKVKSGGESRVKGRRKSDGDDLKVG